METMRNFFHDDPYRKEIKTKIKGCFEEAGKNCIHVWDNIFHPKGGGQKGDRGYLITADGENIEIIDTIKDRHSDIAVLLITSSTISDDLKGKDVTCKIDWDFRYKQMRLHSAVHFHHCMLEKVLGKTLKPPKTSDIEDGFAFNRYDKNKELTPEVVDEASMAFKEQLSMGAEIKNYPDSNKEGFRWWECLGYKIPCGGAHLKNLNEIGSVEITYSKKKGKPTINITI